MAAHTLRPQNIAAGFVDLDERVVTAAPGVVVIYAPNLEVAEAAAAHVARRTAARGPCLVHGPSAHETRARRSGPVFREIADELGLSCSCDVSVCASELASVRATLVLPIPKAGSWDRAVLSELLRLVGQSPALGSPPVSPHGGPPDSSSEKAAPLIVLVCLTGERLPEISEIETQSFDVSERLSSEARRRWFAAVAERACVDPAVEDLAGLDSSFATFRKRIGEGDVPAKLSSHLATRTPASRALLTSLALLGRAFPVHEIAALSSDISALTTLSECGAVKILRGLVSIDRSARAEAEDLASEAPRESRMMVAELLRTHFHEDAWARAGRAELLLEACEFSDAEAAFADALALARDPLARRELVTHWSTLLGDAPVEQKLVLASKSAERALASGRAEEAHHWAELAATAGGDEPEVALLFGRASVATGDLVAASVAFERGASKARDLPLSLLFEAEQAEVAYLRGALDEARERASRVVAGAALARTRLDARNTLGKVLLARAAWEEADRHFEEDAWLASSNGLVTAELRARSNRAITLLSRGLMDKARALFEAVLLEGERRGELRACAFALDNLAVVASHQHQYAVCLELWEQAYRVRQELGDRAALTHVFRSLAFIRMKLGLWEHAEHAIAFGRAMLGPGTPVSSAAYFALCAGRIALMRGRTMQARREALSAVPESRASGDARSLGEAHRLMTRIELEEGNVVRAREALALAQQSLTTEEGRAELSILEAALSRAEGDLDPELALRALSVARLADDEQLLIEAQTLVSEIYRAIGDFDLARRHLDQGLLLRDQVAATLPEHIRAAYLARPDSQLLDRALVLLQSGPVSIPPSSAWGDVSDAPPRSLPRPDVATPSARWRLVGADPSIRSLVSAIKKVAVANCTVLIRGESGTGKELVAQAVHAASDRARGPLITVNCAALVETLLLSELFGHEKGAFTGAASRRRGRFELAEGGTLFLDEIGDISARTQVALLRVLQERTFERVGGAVPIRVDVRIVCATHRDLRAMVERGEFRQDLYYRLRGVTLDVPPLRMRIGDLPLISEHLLGRIARERAEDTKTLSPDALDLLSRHRWPGNVRELENALRAASLFAESGEITAEDLVLNVDDLRVLSEARSGEPLSSLDPLVDGASTEGARGGELATTVAYAQVRGGVASLADIKRQIERDCIARALTETKGNITRAALLLGMKRPRLSQLVKQYGLLAASSSEAS